MTDVLWEVFVYEGPVASDGYGALLAQLPGWTSLSLAPLGDAVGAGQVSIPLSSPVFWQGTNDPETTPVLGYETLWQVRQNGTPVFEFLAQSVDRTTVASDETETVTISGPGTAQCLNWMMAMPFGWEPTDGGFIGVTGAIQDPFNEQDANGNYVLDIALWNLTTPGQVSIPSSTATYTQATAPSGSIQTGAAWFDTSTSPATEYIYDGSAWVLQSNYTGGTSGGSAQVVLTPPGAYVGGGSFTFTNSSFSASVSPAQPANPSAPNCPVGNDPCNGSDVTQMIIKPRSGAGYAMISLSYAQFYCEYSDASGNVSMHEIGPGRAGGTGAYDSSWAQYWRISCDAQSSGGYLYRFWTSGDGSSWVLQWSFTAGSSGWDPSLVNVFMGGTYDTVGGNGAYAQFSSINGEIQANADNGPIYLDTAAMAVVYDQLARAGARGTIPFVSPTFSTQTDSDGNGWVDTWSVQVPNGTDGLTMTQNYAGAIDAHWYMQPGYQLYTGLNPGKRLEDAVIFHHGEINQYGRTQTRDQIYNVAATADGAGMIWTSADSASAAKWGQRETWAASGGTVDAQSAVNTVAAAVKQWADEVDARILQIPPNQNGKTAFIDFGVFDWIGIERSDFIEADANQVIGITVTIDQDGAETHELILLTYRQVMAQWFQYLISKFGGQAASTLGSLTPGSRAGSAFTTALGPNLAISPAQTGGSGSSATGLTSATPVASSPEVAQSTTYATQPVNGVGSDAPNYGNGTGIIPGSLLQTASVPESALSFRLANGTLVTFSSSAPAGPSVGDLWYNTSNGNSLSQWSGTAWQPYQFGPAALSATAADLGGVETYTQATAPTGSINAGSVWYDTSNGNRVNIYTGGSWVAQPLGAAGVSFNALAIGGITVYVQATAPSGSINAGSLWYDTSNNYQLNVYASGSWTAYQFGTNAIAAGTVTTPLLAASAVTASTIAAGAVTAGKIASNAVTAGTIAAGAVTAGTIAAGAVTTSTIAAGAVTTTTLAAGSVISSTIASGAVTAGAIAAGAVTAGAIAANAVTAGTIAAGVVTASTIAANAVTTSAIAAGAVTATQISSGTVVAGIVNGTTISAATFQGTHWLENTNGQYFYSGTPASGNVMISLAPSSTSDPYSNSIPAGITLFGSSGNKLQLYIASSKATVGFPSGAGSEATQASMQMTTYNQGAGNEYMEYRLTGPQSTYDSEGCVIVLDSSALDGSQGFTGYLNAGTGTSATWSNALFSVIHQLYVGVGASGGATLALSGTAHFSSTLQVDGVITAGGMNTNGALWPQSTVSKITGGTPSTYTPSFETSLASAINGIISRLQTVGIIS